MSYSGVFFNNGKVHELKLLSILFWYCFELLIWHLSQAKMHSSQSFLIFVSIMIDFLLVICLNSSIPFDRRGSFKSKGFAKILGIMAFEGLGYTLELPP